LLWDQRKPISVQIIFLEGKRSKETGSLGDFTDMDDKTTNKNPVSNTLFERLPSLELLRIKIGGGLCGQDSLRVTSVKTYNPYIFPQYMYF
jgi:hypothetical protein